MLRRIAHVLRVQADLARFTYQTVDATLLAGGTISLIGGATDGIDLQVEGIYIASGFYLSTANNLALLRELLAGIPQIGHGTETDGMLADLRATLRQHPDH